MSVYCTSISVLGYGSNLGKVIKKKYCGFSPVIHEMEEGQHDSVFCHVMGWQPRELSWSYYCYSWSFHINTAASVLFGLRLSHYAQSIFMLLFLSKLACQWGDLNSCLGCESQMGFKRGGEG